MAGSAIEPGRSVTSKVMAILAQSVLTVAARRLSRELSTGTNATYFALSTEQLTDVRCVRRPEQAPAVRAEGAHLPDAGNFPIAVGQR